MLEVRQIEDRSRWDAFVCGQSDYTFLDAWAWGEFQERMGNKIWRLGVFDGEELVGVGFATLVAARRGRFLFVPHGPIFAQDKNEGSLSLQTFIDHLKIIAKQERCSFIRVSPLVLDTPEHWQAFRSLGFRRAPIHMHAETTWILDLTASEEALLKNMRKTTRYLVRRAEKEGVRVESGNEEEFLKKFYELYSETSQRQHFVPFSYDYIKEEADAFGPDGARVYLAYHNDKLYSGAVIVHYGASAFYHHGASIEQGSIPASYALQWQVIRDAKARGLTRYNFWGVDFRPNHPWSGVTLFKTGFGGSVTAYLPAQDLSLNISYWLNYIIETVRRMRRRY